VPGDAESFDPHTAGDRDEQRAEGGMQSGEQPERDTGERHVGEGVGDEAQTAQHEEEADRRRDDPDHQPGEQRPLHEPILEDLRHG